MGLREAFGDSGPGTAVDSGFFESIPIIRSESYRPSVHDFEQHCNAAWATSIKNDQYSPVILAYLP
ncbi:MULTISPECIES: hypothetical protein [Halobacterium]|uniref:hypothetical protein n=1 Tax=Halobacterium TaxID=2239 RepID=UPI001965EB89|nr:hypothetical protein [Halobacterium sp. GSL-19]QRY23507.1 hypothetical protein JT689_05620 [Halobacterium sp. GSL-19]